MVLFFLGKSRVVAPRQIRTITTLIFCFIIGLTAGIRPFIGYFLPRTRSLAPAFGIPVIAWVVFMQILLFAFAMKRLREL